MTTKYIATYIAAGYTLSPVYNTLSITSTGGVGGTGIYASQKATIVNDGRVIAGYSRPPHPSIELRGGGKVVNGGPTDTSAYIYGRITGKSVNVENYGTINGYVYVHNLLTNGSAADHDVVITGRVEFGVAKKLINPASIKITNFGSITGFVEGLAGILVNGSSTDTSASIYGVVWLRSGFDGLTRAPGTVKNYGTVFNSRIGYRSGGVNLGYEGTTVNGSVRDTAALISGSSYGVFMAPGDSLLNMGTIEGRTSHYGYGGVSGDGYLINGAGSHSSALISGENGVLQSSGEHNFQISNFGTISGANSVNGAGVYLIGVSSLTNGSTTNHSALVEGYTGVVVRGGSSITNLGTIAALGSAGGYGVVMRYNYGSALINGATDDAKATIQGFTGVATKSGTTFMTVTNFGTIEGALGGAVVLQSSTDSLIVEAGSRFEGAVLGGGGTLDFDTGTGNLVGLPGDGTITASGDKSPATAFNAFGTLEVGMTASFSLTGGGSINTGQDVIDMGDLTLSGTVTNNGVVSVDGGAMIVDGAVAGAGAAAINGGTLDFASTFAENVAFSGKTGELELGQSQDYTGTVTGFSPKGTSFDLDDIGFVTANEATYAAGVLTVTDGVHTANIHLAGNYNGQTFIASSDGHGGTDVIAEKSMSPVASPHALISAMAGLGAPMASHVAPGQTWAAREPLLTAPRVAIAWGPLCALS